MNSHLGQFEPGSPQVGVLDSPPRNGHSHTLYGPNGTPLPALRPVVKTTAPQRITEEPEGKTAPPPETEPKPQSTVTSTSPSRTEPDVEEHPKPTTPAPVAGADDRSGWDEFWRAMAARVDQKTAINAAAKTAKANKRKIDHHIPAWAIWPLAGFLVPAAAAAFWLSFEMIQPLVIAAGWSKDVAWLGPIVIDVAAIGAAFMGSISRHPVFVRTGSFLLVTATVLSIVMNLAGHELQKEIEKQLPPGQQTGSELPFLPKAWEWEWTVWLFSVMVPLILATLIHTFGKALMAVLDERAARKRAEEEQRRAAEEARLEKEAQDREQAQAEAEAKQLEAQRKADEEEAKRNAERLMAATQPIPAVRVDQPKPTPPAKTVTANPAPAAPKPAPAPKPEPVTETKPATTWTKENITEFAFEGSFDKLAAEHAVELGLIVARMKAMDDEAGRFLGERALKPKFPNLSYRVYRQIRERMKQESDAS